MPSRRALLRDLAASSLLLATPLAQCLGEPSSTTDPALRPANDLLEQIRRQQLGCVELLEDYLARIQRFNTTLNAVVSLDPARARERAQAADQALADGKLWGPLHGLPMTVKDTFQVAGMPTTSGNLLYREHRPTRNALAVQRLVDAGAVIIGHSNVPPNAGDWQSHNDLYGTSNNPWDPSLTPGGSSGGAAAAVASGLTALELGSDFGGSIRIPAHFTGIYGHRSSYGVIPYQGHIPPPPGVDAVPEMAVAGPLGRSAADLQLAMRVLTTPTGDTPGHAGVTLLPYRPRALEDYRVAAWLDDPYAPLDHSLVSPLGKMLTALRQTGGRVDDTARPGFSLEESHGVYVALVQRVLRGWGPTDTDHRLQALQEAVEEFFTRYDILLMPVARVAAFPHDQQMPMAKRRLSVNGAQVDYIHALSAWIGLASAAGLPATSAPVGFTDTGLPVGVQIIGRRRNDWLTLDFARQLADVVGGFVVPNGYR